MALMLAPDVLDDSVVLSHGCVYSIGVRNTTGATAVAVELPPWLESLRHTEVVDRVGNDPRSLAGSVLGLRRNEAMDAIGWGQAQFDEPWGGMPPEDRVLLYAYFNQKGHLEELTEAFRMIFANQAPEDPIVVDLGCGPCTGGLALAGVLEAPVFDYIGVDLSATMRKFGEHLAAAAAQLHGVRRRWAGDLPSVEWDRAPGWRPVLVIVSYLLASTTLDPVQLVADLDKLLDRLGNGRVTMLYTNSPRAEANRNFPAFQQAMHRAGFDMPADGTGEIVIERWAGDRVRHVRQAVFHRDQKNRLQLGGG